MDRHHRRGQDGEVEIDLEEAEVTLTTKASTTSGTFDNASPELEELMNERYGQSTKGLIFNRSLRYRETYLKDGDEVMIVGDVDVEKGEAPEFYKGEHHLVVTDMEEEELAGTYGRRSIGFWILFGFCIFFIVIACGMGGVFVVVGGIVTGAGLKKGDAGKILPELPAPVAMVQPVRQILLPVPAAPMTQSVRALASVRAAAWCRALCRRRRRRRLPSAARRPRA
jgi:hypothetical protein